MSITVNNDTQWAATECTIYPCARRIGGETENNNYTETYDTITNPGQAPVDSWCEWVEADQDLLPAALGDVNVLIQPPPWPAGSNASERLSLGLIDESCRSIEAFFFGAFNGSAIAMSDIFEFKAGDIPSYASSDILSAIYYGKFSGCNADNKDPIYCAMSNVARAMTKTFRDSAYVAQGYHGVTLANMTRGATLVEHVYIHITWYWLILPVLVWFLAVGLWVSAAATTWRHKAPMWRNNPLPLLFLYDGDGKIDGAEPRDGEGTSSRAYIGRARLVSAQLRLNSGHAHLE